MTICSCIFWTGLNLLHWDLLCFAPSWARMLCKLFGVLFWVSSSGRLGEGLTPQWILSILRLLNYCFGASSVWTDCNAEHLRCYHQSQCHEVQIHHDDLLHRLKDNVCHRHGMLVHHCQTDFWTVWVTFSLAKATGFESPESVVMNSLSYCVKVTGFSFSNMMLLTTTWTSFANVGVAWSCSQKCPWERVAFVFGWW